MHNAASIVVATHYFCRIIIEIPFVPFKDVPSQSRGHSGHIVRDQKSSSLF